MNATAAVTILAICPTCSEVRYRTRTPVSSPEQCRPESFEPVGDAPAPQGEAPPVCHRCEAMLVFTTEDRWTARFDGARRPIAAPAAPAAPAAITLFEAGRDETIREIRDVPGGLLVITSRRIVRVGV